MMSERTFTEEELELYDGRDGRPAYVAVDGTVYDVTPVMAWKGGAHHGNRAGHDFSETILKSPHGKRTLTSLEVVGRLENN